jgi:subtilisin family serine protease
MRAALLLATSLILIGPGMILAGNASADTSWRVKADKELLEAFDSGAPSLTIQVVGPKMSLPSEPMPDRAAWKAYWAAESAPFLAMVRDFAEQRGATVTQEIPALRAAFLTLPRQAVPDLVSRPEVRMGNLDWMGATYVLGGEAPGVQVALDQTIAKVEAKQMWDLGFKGEGVSIAVIDTGIRGSHEMMKNADGSSRVVGWFDATGPAGKCNTPCDTHSHGTHVATTSVGSNLFNANSQQGVAPRAIVHGVRIFQGGGGTWEDAQEGLQGAFDLGSEITTNSWGGGCSGGGITTAELAETLQNAGMMNVFAAGNSGTGGVICPGAVHNVLTVGAIDINEVVAGFSSRGPCNWKGVSITCPDVMAVGVDVLAGCHSSDTCYTTMSGTSMATPHVGGVVVLLQQAWKASHGGQGLDAAGKQAEIILRYSAKDLGAGGPDNDYGWGLAKAKAAYDLMSSDAPLNLKHIFSIGKSVMRAYETNNIAFSVVNLGSVTVSGPMTLDIVQRDTGDCPPTCDSVSVAKSIALGPFTENMVSYAFDGAQHPAGNYDVDASLAYTSSGGSGTITDSGSFLLKKVNMVKSRAIPALTTTGTLIFGGWEFRNTGNENATQVRFIDVLRTDGFAPAGAVPPGVGPYGLFANPAPDNVNLLSRFNPPEARFTWNNIGEIKYGTSWEASANFVAGAPGDYPFKGTLYYADETGRQFVETFNVVHTVKAPLS